MPCMEKIFISIKKMIKNSNLLIAVIAVILSSSRLVAADNCEGCKYGS